MDVGISGFFGSSPKRDMAFAREYGQCAEELGFASLYCPEHVVFFPEYESKYPYALDGNPNFGPSIGLYDPLVVSTVVGSATSSLRLVTSVMILPERPALLTAKEVMCVDHACGGRFELGIGVGWSSEEYAALGVPFEHRGARCDEYIQAMRAAWTQDRASFHGRFVDFDDVVLLPHPVRGDITILVGGESAPAMRRAVGLADGWYGWWPRGSLEEHVERLDAEFARQGRDRDDGFSMRIGVPLDADQYEVAAARAETARSLGFDEFVVGAGIPTRGFDEHLRRFAEALGLKKS
jgi:probable F420-dependent oxidoreductase